MRDRHKSEGSLADFLVLFFPGSAFVTVDGHCQTRE